VLLAGAMAFQNQWDLFSGKWRKKLENPSPGKSALCRFHMFECQHSIGEFVGWNRVATDFLVRELVDISKSVMIRAHVCAVLRRDWDELVNGDMRRVFGDAEGFCIKMMYTRCLSMAQRYFSAKDVAFVFDDRPERARENNLVYRLFQLYHQNSAEPSPVSLSFGSSCKFVPLQIADVIAWELYQHSERIWNSGNKDIEVDRPQLKHLVTGGRISYGIATKDVIQKMLQMEVGNESFMKQVGDFMEANGAVHS
jgi:hypothetical protein